MGVRPPTGDDDGEPELVEFGIAALAPLVEEAEIEFPATRTELARALGDAQVPIDAHGRSVPLARALEDADRERFESERELMNALHPVFETYRSNVSSGWLSSLRRSLPF